jgi:Skp family chaperone for outer membrane proteins
MKSVTKRIVLIASLLVLGAAYSMAMRPSVVVTVDLAKVVDNLDQRGQASASLNAIGEKYKAQEENYRTRVKEMEDTIEPLLDLPETPERRAMQEDLVALSFEFQAWVRFAADKMDVERSLLMRDLYRSVKAAVKTMAEAEGFDIVIVDDSQGELLTSDEARVSREAQVRQQIAARRVLYTAPSVDVTEQLIVRMNNEFKAGPVAAAKPGEAQ